MLFRFPSLFLLTALIAVPFNVLAATSKTYTINSAASSNYTTVGTSLTTKATTSWYNPSYSHRLTLTINKEQIGEELTDFPIVVQLDSAQSHLFNTVREDGHDLVFTDKNNQKLSHEIESFDKNSKEATIWVKVPTLKPTEDTVLYLFYGNPVAEDNQNKEDVWSNGFVAVHHLNQDPSGSILDSTNHNFDGTQNGGMNRNDNLVRGKIGQALNFDADRIDLGTNIHVDYLTVQAWAKRDTSGTSQQITSNNLSGHLEWQLFHISNGQYRLRIDTPNNFHTVTSNASVDTGVWHQVSATYDGQISKLYVNGSVDNEQTHPEGGPIKTISNRNRSIGGDSASSSWDGLLDEIRISSAARSSAWISAEYANQSGDEDFLTISTPTNTGTTSTSLITLKKDKALSYTSLHNFTPNGSTNITYQLSPNAGTTWYYYTKNGWTKTSANTPIKSSSANDINAHIKTLPDGTGKLLWRAILQPNSTLDSIKIDYTAGTAISNPTTDLTSKINSLFRLVYGQDPTAEQHSYWITRLKDKTTVPALFGAMQWQKMFGN